MSPFSASLYAFGALMALVSVMADAFAAHGLVTAAPAMEQAVVWFKEGANFQMNHALGVLIATAAADRAALGPPRAIFRMSAILLASSTVLFPGALYSISFAGPGFFAPWGGFVAMMGWILFATGAVKALSRTAAKGEGSDVR